MNANRISTLLHQLQVIRRPCDLDLLLFFHRHPRALLTSEQVGSFLGYDLKQVALSLDTMIDAGLLERSQTQTHAARLYILTLQGPQRGPLSSLLEIASTPHGRQSVLRLLEPGPDSTRSADSASLGSLKRIA